MSVLSDDYYKKTQEAVKKEIIEKEPTDFANVTWNGLSALYNALGGRAHYNIGMERIYTKWPVSFSDQSIEMEAGTQYSRPFRVTEIIPFDGYPVKIL